jgi:hypothetical protein
VLICIPMAGRSSRFTAAGFTVPKYRLELSGRPVFDYAVRSFAAYFDKAEFIFCVLNVEEAKAFVDKRCALLGIQKYQIILLDTVTRGQAETVYIGLEKSRTSNVGPLVIFNIDSFRSGFQLYERAREASGYLEVFEGEGDGWSFVKEDASRPGYAAAVREKHRISRWCSNGLYVFRDIETYRSAYLSDLISPSQSIGELYIAPIYNHLITTGNVLIRFLGSKETIFCGTPEEYNLLKQTDIGR